MVVFSSVSALKFLKENLVGAFKPAKHAQRRTIGIKIWLYTHPRNFGCDKLVRPSLPPYVYLMLSKKEILFKVCIKRLYKSLLSIEINNFMYCFNVDIGNIVVAYIESKKKKRKMKEKMITIISLDVSSLNGAQQCDC